MKINIHIVYDAIKDISTDARCGNDWRLCIAGVRILFPKTENVVLADFLYVVDDDTVDCLLDNNPGAPFVYCGSRSFEEMSEETSVLFISVLKQYSVKEVYEIIVGLVETMSAWYEELVTSMLKGSSLQAVMDIGARFITNPVALHDASSLLCVQSGVFPDGYSDLIWDDLKKTKLGFSSEVAAALTRDENLSKDGVSMLKRVSGSTQLPYEAITIDIASSSAMIGFLGSTSAWSNFSLGQISLLVTLANCLRYAESAIIRFNAKKGYMNDIAEALITGKDIDPWVYERAAEHLGWIDAGHNFVVTIIDMREAELDGRVLRNHDKLYHSYWQLLQRDSIEKEEVILLIGSLLVIVLPGHGLISKVVNDKYNRIKALFSPLIFRMGVSEPFQDFTDVRQFFDQAVASLSIGRRLDQDGVIYYFKDYAVEYLFDVALGLKAKSYCCWAAMKLRDFDLENDTEYLETLRCLFTNGGNLSKTAEELFMHRNTLGYRIRKIESLIGIDDIKTLDWTYFLLSCRIMRWDSRKLSNLDKR